MAKVCVAALDNNQSIPDVIVSDIRMRLVSMGSPVIAVDPGKQPDIPVIIMTAHSDLDSAVNAYQKAVHLNIYQSHLILMKPSHWCRFVAESHYSIA